MIFLFGVGTFEVVLLLGVFAVVAILLAKFLAARIAGPPPLNIDPDDPDMRAAIERARASLDVFDGRLEAGDAEAYLKYAIGEEGSQEHVWAQVLGAEEGGYRVELVSQPIDSRFAAPEAFVLGRDAVEDWQLLHRDGSIEGGFTQRVLFDKARATWGKLPGALASEEKRYRPLA